MTFAPLYVVFVIVTRHEKRSQNPLRPIDARSAWQQLTSRSRTAQPVVETVLVSSVYPARVHAVGFTLFDDADGALEPTAFFATTVNVYGVPFARPGTMAVVDVASTSTDTAPGDDVT